MTDPEPTLAEFLALARLTPAPPSDRLTDARLDELEVRHAFSAEIKAMIRELRERRARDQPSRPAAEMAAGHPASRIPMGTSETKYCPFQDYSGLEG